MPAVLAGWCWPPVARWFSIKKSKRLVRALLSTAANGLLSHAAPAPTGGGGHDMGACMPAAPPRSPCLDILTTVCAVQTFTELPATVAELLAPAVPGADPPWAKQPGVAIPSYKGFKVAAECPMLGERARCWAPEWAGRCHA